MKKSLTLGSIIVLTLLCSCAAAQNSATQIYFDTAVTLTADCSEDALTGAFSLCEKYDKSLSRTKKDSEISLLADGKRQVSPDTLEVIKKGLYYCKLSGGKFDITVCELSDLWNLKDGVVPSRDEIAEALKNVDYHSIEVSDNSVNTNGKSIDLGGIAKGYIADKLLEYFKDKNTKSGIINIGGNITVFGKKVYNIGIKKPFSEEDIAVTLRLKNKSVSTSGIYERYFKKNGRLYHHIIDTETGYPADTDLLSASVIGDTSADCDALSTICILYGLDNAEKLIENTPGFEAIFIDKDYNLHFTRGLERKEDVITFKKR